MNREPLYTFLISHLPQLPDDGRGVLIVRNTPLSDVIKEFDAFLAKPEVSSVVQFVKKEDVNHPNMVIYHGPANRHLVFGLNEEGWKGDYGLTHTDYVVSIH